MNKYIKLFLVAVILFSVDVQAKKCRKFDSIVVHNLCACNATVGGIPFGSLTAFAYAANETPGAIIPDGGDLIFNRTTSFASSNVTFSPSTPDFTLITVPAGTYFFAYSVVAIGTIFPGDPLSFALFNHTSGMIVPISQYNSDQALANPILTKGYGLAMFSVTTTLSLRNLSGQPIALATGLPVNNSVIDSLTLMRISA